MELYFITGNKNKFLEVKEMLSNVKMLDIDLPEIQSIDPKEIIKAKLVAAKKFKKGEFIVEDTSLYFDCLNGLPGPFIKWFLERLGNKGLYELAKKMGNDKAIAKTVVGFIDKKGKMHFFEGINKGRIVKPSKKATFGWNPIFLPDGQTKTFEEMSQEHKNKISMRRKAIDKLKKHLKN